MAQHCSKSGVLVTKGPYVRQAGVGACYLYYIDYWRQNLFHNLKRFRDV